MKTQEFLHRAHQLIKSRQKDQLLSALNSEIDLVKSNITTILSFFSPKHKGCIKIFAKFCKKNEIKITYEMLKNSGTLDMFHYFLDSENNETPLTIWPNNEIFDCFCQALEDNNFLMIKLLIHHFAKLDIVNSHKETALHFSAQSNIKPIILKYLLNHSYNTDENSDGKMPIEIAIHNIRNIKFLKIWLNKHKTYVTDFADPSYTKLISTAAISKSVAKIKLCINATPDSYKEMHVMKILEHMPQNAYSPQIVNQLLTQIDLSHIDTKTAKKIILNINNTQPNQNIKKLLDHNIILFSDTDILYQTICIKNIDLLTYMIKKHEYLDFKINGNTIYDLICQFFNPKEHKKLFDIVEHKTPDEGLYQDIHTIELIGND
jgi:hypothetical protein